MFFRYNAVCDVGNAMRRQGLLMAVAGNGIFRLVPANLNNKGKAKRENRPNKGTEAEQGVTKRLQIPAFNET